MNGLIDYECVVHESGYEIVTSHEPQTDHRFEPTSLINSGKYSYIRPIDPKSAKRTYNIMEFSGAYNEFMTSLSKAALDATNSANLDVCVPILRDSIIKFANKYGLLTGVVQEETSIWFPQTFMMQIAVMSLSGIREQKTKQLDQFFIKKDGVFRTRISFGSLFGGNADILTIGETPPRSLSEAAYHFICKVVNKNIKDSLVTEIVTNRTNTGVTMIVRPKDLISALWLQLAHAVSRNLEFKQCVECSTFFEVKSKKRKDQKKYCSTRCRVRVGARKRRAEEKARLEKEKAK